MPYISFTEEDVRHTCELPADKMTVFGREEHVDFQILNDSLISREHFSIEKDDEENYVLIDLGSSNGTFLNSRRIEANSLKILKDGDKIRAGRMEFTYHLFKPAIKKSDPVKEIVNNMKQGKGYKTLMMEIIGEKQKKTIKRNDQTFQPDSISVS